MTSSSSRSTKRTLTEADLDLVYLRVQEPDGHWATRHVGECSDAQFDAWAHTRFMLPNCDHRWTMEERATLCNILWQEDALHILRREAFDDSAKEEEARGDVGLGQG